MEFIQYRTESAFQGSPVTTQNGVNEGQNLHGDMSVEDLVLSMRQDLLVDSVSNHVFDPTVGGNGIGNVMSVHRQPGAVSVRINGIGSHVCENEHGNIETGNVFGGHDDDESNGMHTKPYRQVGMRIETECNFNQVQLQQSQNESVCKMPGTANQPVNSSMSNGFVRHNKSQPQLASQFYQQLRMTWGPSQNVAPVNTEHKMDSGESLTCINNGPSQFEPEFGLRMLPKPPQEPRRGSQTRGSLRRAANLLLKRNRQSVSDGEVTRKPTPPSTPRDELERKKGTKSQTIRERLQKNKSKMGDLLRSPKLSRARRLSHGNISTDSSLSPTDVIQTDHRKYASAENLEGINFHCRTENQTLKQATKNTRLTSKPSSEAFSSRSDDTDDHEYIRRSPPGYKLRRHSSGPVYHASSEMNTHRGYHTADSDTDSGISRVNTNISQIQTRNDAYKALPTTRDTLRMLSKKREVTSTSSRHMGKSVSGPLRADHNIQPVSGAVNANSDLYQLDERLQADKPDVWTEQGARPKLSSSMESLETEEMRHEIFPDTLIGMEHKSPHEDRRDKVHQQASSSVKSDSRRSDRNSRPPSPSRARPPSSRARPPSSRARPPSPSRSVHFEDSNLLRDERYERRPHSRSQSRTQRCPDDSNQLTLATSVKSKANTAHDFVETESKDFHHRNESGHNAYSCIDDTHTYSSEMDHRSRIITNDNPYEEIQVQGCMKSEEKVHVSNGKAVSNKWRDTDSFDGLYAEVQKKRPERKKQHFKSPLRESGESKVKHPGSAGGIRDDFSVQAPCDEEPIYAQVNKAKKKPPSGVKLTSRHHSQYKDINSNPCVTSDFDNSISFVENDTKDGLAFNRNFEHYSDLSGSRLSITSRASISEKMQSIGKATKKKFSSMRRALSLDRIDTSTQEDDTQPKLKRSPSLRSLTGIFSKKDKTHDNTDSKRNLHKKRSASISGLYVRPQRTSEETDVTSPSHMRKVGKLLNINSDGSQTVELIKPPSGPFGFYIARGTSNFGSGVFVTRLGDGHPAKILAGLLAVGDEILDINGVDVRNRPIDDVYDMMMDNDKLILRLVPIATRSTWTE
ncbi:uncharacterized protein LOC110976394 [Acanthaster planci]|uniref:Uncharacterized protein LOC110976394 n=1 Tax=Acanthaster planci TaxID=133434 RepID=A0A8B7XYG7_ACAPL|nr:uncharacterized protein LOC110976394 [Acanthaster planci]